MADIRDYFLARREELIKEIAQLKQKQNTLKTLYGASASDALAEQQGIIEAIETKLEAIDAALSGHDPEGAVKAQVEQSLANMQEQKAFEISSPSALNGPILDLIAQATPILSGALSGHLDRQAAKQTLQSILDQLDQFRNQTLLQIATLSQHSDPSNAALIAGLQNVLQTYQADAEKIGMLMRALIVPSSAPTESPSAAVTSPSTSSSPHYAHALPGTALYMPSTHTDEALVVSQTATEEQSSMDIPQRST